MLIVLWLSAALAAIGLSVSARVRAETDHVSTSADGLRAHYLATGAVERAIQWMTWGPGERNPDGSPRFWEPNQPRLIMSFPSGDAVVEMIPESSKLNVNYASPDDLLRVVASVSGDVALARDITAAIIDWRSAPTGPSPFDAYYLAIGPTFRPRHASLEEIEELLSVRGVTPELFYGNYVADAQGQLYARGGLRDALSVWGSAGPFDANTVSPALMEAIGIPPAAVEALVERRNLRPFRSTQELMELGVPTQRLSVGGNYIWTLRATARLRRADGTPSDVVRSASATIKYWVASRYQQTPVHVMRFYDDAWSEFAIAPPAAVNGVIVQ